MMAAPMLRVFAVSLVLTTAAALIVSSTSRATIAVNFKIDNVDFSHMTNSQRVSMSSVVSTTIATKLGVNNGDVEVRLSAGSVQVDVAITPPAGADLVVLWQFVEMEEEHIKSGVVNAVAAAFDDLPATGVFSISRYSTDYIAPTSANVVFATAGVTQAPSPTQAPTDCFCPADFPTCNAPTGTCFSTGIIPVPSDICVGICTQSVVTPEPTPGTPAPPIPTIVPTTPTRAPTQNPTITPTGTQDPTSNPTENPSGVPTGIPSIAPTSNPTLIPTTAPTEPCLTIAGGNVPAGLECKFPFTYGGTEYHGCSMAAHIKLWCYTEVKGTANYSRDKWGFCSTHCPVAPTKAPTPAPTKPPTTVAPTKNPTDSPLGKSCFEKCQLLEGPCTFCGSFSCCSADRIESPQCAKATGAKHGEYTCVETGIVDERSPTYCPPLAEKTSLNQYDLRVEVLNATGLPNLLGSNGFLRTDKPDPYAEVKVKFHSMSSLIAVTKLGDNIATPLWGLDCWFQSPSYPDNAAVQIEVKVYDHNDNRIHVLIGTATHTTPPSIFENSVPVVVDLKCEEKISCDERPDRKPRLHLKFEWKRDAAARSRMVTYLGIRFGIGALVVLVVAGVAFAVLASRRKGQSGGHPRDEGVEMPAMRRP